MRLDTMRELNTEQLRKGLLKYTKKAFQMLPKMDEPLVLDIGCGTGIPTLELARSTNGMIIGIDIDHAALNKLKSRIEKEGLSNRVETVYSSIYKTNFPNGYFDILWDEGVLHLLDLKRSLKECNRLLKPSGFLVVGEMISWFNKNCVLFPDYGFKLTRHFLLPTGCWWNEYYELLERRIKRILAECPNSRDLEEFKRHEEEIEMVKRNPRGFDCGFYILQKSDECKA